MAVAFISSLISTTKNVITVRQSYYYFFFDKCDFIRLCQQEFAHRTCRLERNLPPVSNPGRL